MTWIYLLDSIAFAAAYFVKWRLNRTYQKWDAVPNQHGVSGAQTAAAILAANGVDHVKTGHPGLLPFVVNVLHCAPSAPRSTSPIAAISLLHGLARIGTVAIQPSGSGFGVVRARASTTPAVEPAHCRTARSRGFMNFMRRRGRSAWT